MTDRHSRDESTEPTAAGLGRLQAAESDVRSIQNTLRAAEDGRTDAAEVRAALAAYWRNHQPALEEAGIAVLEALRLQTLEALYRWRAQLNAQLGARFGAAPTSDQTRET